MVTIVIIGLLVSLAAPSLFKYLDRAKSVRCANNLRQVGAAVLAYVGEHDGYFPAIEPNPENPVYPDGEADGTMIEVLGPYGATSAMLRCPSDSGEESYHQRMGTSYEWRPLLDEENSGAPNLYFRRGVYQVPLSRVRIVIDFEPFHNGRMNRLYGDGRVKSY